MSVTLFLALATGIGARLFGGGSHRNGIGRQQKQEIKSYVNKRISSGGSHKSLRGELEALYGEAEFLIEGVGQIQLAVDNVAVEDKMLEEMDDRLDNLREYYLDDIDELLRKLKEVTNTGVVKGIKAQGGLPDGVCQNEQCEVIVIDQLTPPDPNNKGDWASLSSLAWN